MLPPTLIASSVIRGAQLGESHGGLYLVDLQTGKVELKLDWNRTDIDISGRGGDRGLRGIAFHGDTLLVAANSSLLMLDQDFRLLESFSNSYLQHCHEIAVVDDQVFLTATGCDSVLVFDLPSRRFSRGLHFGVVDESITLRHFDPGRPEGPSESHRLHLNSVTASQQRLWVSGLHTPGLLSTDGKRLDLIAPLPQGTHNARIWRDGVLFNDTAADRVCYVSAAAQVRIAVPRFDRSEIVNIERFESSVARAAFARGLCALPNGLIAAGSSPSTISLYDIGAGTRISDFNISMDVRNAIHGLAVWPYS